MAKPALTESAERLYNMLAPTWFKEDEKQNWAGATFCAGLAKMLDPVAEIVQPRLSGTKNLPGFSVLFEPMKIPANWLTWLAQWVGVDLSQSPNVATSREWIAHPLGWERGTNSAMKLKAIATLTGKKTIYFYDRWNGEAFLLKVTVVEGECPEPTKTRQAVESLMAAWQVLEFVVAKGGTYAILEASHPKYSEVEAAHTKYQDLEEKPEK